MLDRIWYGRSRLAWLLLPASFVYRLLFVIDRAVRSRRRTRARVPVVVIGNVTVGGTGKTPLVIYIARALREHGLAAGIVSRGYRGRAARNPRPVAADDDPADVGDEPILLARASGCPVVVCADRGAAVEHLERSTAVDVVLADDGLQHHALARTVEIVVVDGARGLGNGHCLPAGPLREPARRLDSVDAVVVNGPGWSRDGAVIGDLEVSAVRRLDGTDERAIGTFRGERVHAFAAIGNPRRFFELLRRHDIVVIEHAKADHAYISPRELEAAGGGTIMVTEKDAVKLGRDAPANVWCVAVDYRFERTEAERLMRSILHKLRTEVPS